VTKPDHLILKVLHCLEQKNWNEWR